MTKSVESRRRLLESGREMVLETPLPDDGEDWILFSCAVLAMLPGITQPLDEDAQDVWTWVGDRKAGTSEV